VQFSFDVLFRAGFLLIITVAEPGAQGAGVTGMQGMGVSTPCAAVVAAATWGFANDEHMPKGMILVIGILSMMVPADILPVLTLLLGKSTNVLGAAPKEH
jgi:hypothetical protein